MHATGRALQRLALRHGHENVAPPLLRHRVDAIDDDVTQIADCGRFDQLDVQGLSRVQHRVEIECTRAVPQCRDGSKIVVLRGAEFVAAAVAL
jgi:hypothetical protein